MNTKQDLEVGSIVIAPYRDGSSIGKITAIVDSIAHIKPYTGNALRLMTSVRHLRPVPYRVSIKHAS